MNQETDGGDWKDYQLLILNELERHDNLLNSQGKEINNLKPENAILKIKSGLWGIAAGAIPVIIALALNALK